MITSFPTAIELWALIWPALMYLLIIMVVDLIFGVIEALVNKTFEWQCLMHFVNTDLIPIMAWIAWVVITAIPGGFSQFLPITANVLYWIIAASMIGSFLKSVAELGVLVEPLHSIGVRTEAKAALVDCDDAPVG